MLRIAGLEHGARALDHARGDLSGHQGLCVALHRGDHAGDDREHDDRRDVGEGHEAKPLPRRGAVQFRRLVLLLRYVEQRGHEDHHQVADAPQEHQGQGRLGPVRVVEPARRRNADLLQDRVDRAGARVEEEGEGHGGRHRRGEVGQVEQGAEDTRTGLDLRDEHADPEPEQDAQSHHDHDQPQGVAQGRPEERVVLEDVRPVLRAAPRRRLEAVVVHEREVDRRDHRVREEDREADQPGGQEGEGAQRRAPLLRLQRVGGHRYFACAMSVSICAAAFFRPACRSVTLPLS